VGRLDGKRALVTGGGAGIGEAIARAFVAEGAAVLVADRDTKARERVEAFGAGFVTCDVGDPQQVGAAAAVAVDRLGGVDVAVANAGYELVADALELSYEDWDGHQAVMLRGVYATFRSVLPDMLERGSGSLIGVASQLAFVGLPRFTSYLAAKAGVVGLVRGIAIDFGERGIRCNALCPGPTRTPLLERQVEGIDNPEAQLAAWGRDTVLGRLGRPDEIAWGAVFLASDESSFMTGQPLIIDGGYTAR
jgi:NAD(P)-dependent dehydrogenase (short-subunit alcohol dehydrogenase family)